jgi:hypothetical protein
MRCDMLLLFDAVLYESRMPKVSWASFNELAVYV